MLIDNSIDALIDCLSRCKKLLETNLTKKNTVIIFSENIKDYEKLILSLTVEGIDTYVPNSDESFINIIQFKSPGAIIIENDSRNNDGLTLYRFLLDEGSIRNIPVIFTGDDNKEAKVKALLLGAVDYIAKPFEEIDAFIKIINIIKIVNENKSEDIDVFSRTYGKEKATALFKKAKNGRNNFTILRVDMDNMAQINLLLGITIGNQILRDVVDILRAYLDKKDFIYRISGDEFVLVLLDRDEDQVLELAKSMHNDMNRLSKKYGTTINFTGGIASLINETDEYDDILEYAWECLKRAKRNGKGVSYIHSASPAKVIRKRLLFIDNDSIILKILSSRYSSKGYEIFKARDMEEAVKILESNKVNVIITELIIPGITGMELLKKLKNIDEKAKIIVLSSLNTENHISIAFNSGADDFLAKPFSPVELDLRIKRLVV